MTVVDAVEVPPAGPALEGDWRFTEFVMRTWTEPELAARYRRDPVATLAEFGIGLRGAGEAPRLDTGAGDEVVVERFAHPSAGAVWPCCIEDPQRPSAEAAVWPCCIEDPRSPLADAADRPGRAG
ncbi:hypothetical protein PS9374_02809 [Planomonospora sphaerica]|uniref:Uncharacterized protein n=1 Tax=Planomonospora sphaerica TaxID=161355 RepID=A0A171CSN7_9ACTN|nr:hypothetical protein [Planomonospora sphaerica]GAT67156.1 hypothetical protein PS9374_02809 [Planomonospora sphaerica]